MDTSSTGKKLGIVYEGEILKFCRNEDSANNFIAQHRKTVKKLAQSDAKYKFNANIII